MFPNLAERGIFFSEQGADHLWLHVVELAPGQYDMIANIHAEEEDAVAHAAQVGVVRKTFSVAKAIVLLEGFYDKVDVVLQ